MSRISESLSQIRSSLPAGVTLAAVSKFHPVEALAEAYACGQRVFAESRAAELAEKAGQLPADIEWHFIGHLQTNKVRTVVPHATVIQSIDSERVLRAVDAESARLGKCTDVLLQLHVAQEATKYGLTPDEAVALATDVVPDLANVRVTGVMGMASNVDDEERIRADFRTIRSVFDRLKSTVFADADSFATVSMGMSDDREIAIAEGSTMVRIGTDIFGQREY